MPLVFLNYIKNALILNLTNTEYLEFPKIYGTIIIRGRGRLFIGKKCKINSNEYSNPVGMKKKCMYYIGPNATIIIGNNVGISTSLLYANSNITIEDNVLIGGGCQLLDSDFHSLSYEERIINGDNNVVSKPILIKKGAFVGANSIILKGTIIGERSIVAAGSVVAKSIPNDEIWGGNPVKFIKKINDLQ